MKAKGVGDISETARGVFFFPSNIQRLTNLLKIPSECDSQPTPHLTYFCLSPDMCGIWDVVIQVFDSVRRSNIKANSGMWRGDVLSNRHFLKNIKKAQMFL